MKFTWKSVSDRLSDGQMKQVIGGSYGYGSSFGSCCYKTASGVCECGVSQGVAVHMAVCSGSNGTNCQGNWCCDSCGSASYGNC